jgi:hypothetical protein
LSEQKFIVYRPAEEGEDVHPHACTGGLVFLTYVVFDEEIGDEAEFIEAVSCRRCQEDLSD